MPEVDVLRLRDIDATDLAALLARFGLELVLVEDGAEIPGSFWGDSEAGLTGNRVHARGDTPVHSVLHETCHVICMDPGRRAGLDTDAGSDDLEEAAVCYLQVLLAGALPGVGSERAMQDMDRWGYSFRLGGTARWFSNDAGDAQQWLRQHGLIAASGEPLYRLRR